MKKSYKVAILGLLALAAIIPARAQTKRDFVSARDWSRNYTIQALQGLMDGTRHDVDDMTAASIAEAKKRFPDNPKLQLWFASCASEIVSNALAGAAAVVTGEGSVEYKRAMAEAYITGLQGSMGQ